MEIRKQNNIVKPGRANSSSVSARQEVDDHHHHHHHHKMMLRFLSAIFVLSLATCDGASVGVVLLDGEAAPQVEPHSDIDNVESLSFLSQYGYLPVRRSQTDAEIRRTGGDRSAGRGDKEADEVSPVWSS